MSRLRVWLASVLGVLLLGAVGASGASATEPTAKCEILGAAFALTQVCVQDKAGELFVLGLPALETIEFLGSQEEGRTHELEIPSIGLKIVCPSGSATGLVDGQPTESALLEHVLIVFKGCILVGVEAECEILSDGPLTTGTPGLIEWHEFLDADFEKQSTEDGALEFLPEAGTTFAEFSIDARTGQECAFAQLGLVLLGEANPLCVLLASNDTLEEKDEETKLLECSKAKFVLLEREWLVTMTFEVLLDRPAMWSSAVWAEHPPGGSFLTEIIS